MGSKTRLSSYCTKRGDNTVNLVTSRKTNSRLARPIEGLKCVLRAATDESQKTRNKKQETKRFSTFAVYRLRHSETKKTLLDSRIKF